MRKYILILGACIALSANAQSVSYAHDASKMNQVTVMEIGSGTLTPDFWYWMVHNNYKKTASAKNKLRFRTTAGINAYNQVDMAKSMDSAMVKRAEAEALNVADRKGGTLDIAWLAEGAKITDKLEKFHRNIEKMIVAGGNQDNKERWNHYYKMFQCAIKATQDAYMPNAQRKKQYLKIYADICKQNETLVKYIVHLTQNKSTTEFLAATYQKPNHIKAIATASKNKWTSASWLTTGKDTEE